MKLGKLDKLDLRDIWLHETSGFSTWLEEKENLFELSKEIGIEIELIRREAIAGKFRADILAKDSLTGEIIIIENQIENSDHSHLGKLITYSSHYNAKTIIWILKELRIEHEKAIEWLNLNLNDEINIFLVKLEIFKIGNSLPAPKFTIISKPYGWTNKLTRPDVEIEPLPDKIIAIENFKNSISKTSLIDFLNKEIKIGVTYAKKNIYKKYVQSHKKDGLYYERHKQKFRKDLISWGRINDLELNKEYQDDKYKGFHKSGGIEFITFTKVE